MCIRYRYNVNGLISDQSWPKYEENYLNNDSMNIAVQFNGKTRGIITLNSAFSKDQILNKIKNDQKFNKYLNDSSIKKEIYIPNRIVNFVVTQK